MPTTIIEDTTRAIVQIIETPPPIVEVYFSAGGSGGGSVTGAINEGTGEGVYRGTVGSVLAFKSLKAGKGVTISSTATEITIDAVKFTSLDVATYGDFDGIAWASVKTGYYYIVGTGSQFSNIPTGFELLPMAMYTFFVEILNDPVEWFSKFVFTTANDFTNPDLGRECYRVGADFGSAVATGWKVYALVSDIQSIRASDVNIITYTAPSAIGGHRVVRSNSFGLDYADHTVLTDSQSVVGITKNAASAGAPLEVVTHGLVTEPSWNFTTGSALFLSTNGLLTETPPDSGFQLIVAKAISPTTVLVDIKLPIIL